MARPIVRPPPFPADIDRNDFGHWLSGFTDGEGCFTLYLNRSRGGSYPSVRFGIQLRADDTAVLALIRSYFGCGGLYPIPPKTKSHSQAQTAFVVAAVCDLFGIVVPHFDRFPLRAKKQADYLVWREGVRLCHTVASRKSPGWSASERVRFLALRDSLTEGRRFPEAVLSAITLPDPLHERTLFDGLEGP